MKKQTSIILTILLLSFAGMSYAQQPVIPLYPGVAPGSENSTQKEMTFTADDGQPRIRNVAQPTLTAFLPDKAKANGTAIIVAPGGGFRHLAIEKEGNDVARWLQARGVAAFVLKYRLMDTGATEEEYKKQQAALANALRPDTKNPAAGLARNLEWQKAIAIAVADGQQAVRVVRGRAAEWGIAPDRIGLMGFSAGGMLTVGAVMKNEAASRPNFAAPIYGGGTNGVAVAADAPPIFIAVADDDRLAAVSSAQLYLNWRKAGRKAELHVYAAGGHGFGMTKRGLPVDSWVDRFGDWLQAQGLLQKPAAQ
ncbi:MAG: alpha/beta hydrolase [Blastocatellales bacterium]